jgi:putative membrane protein insertion efficiency factor
LKEILLGLLSLWQKTRLVRKPCCRFYPSCSNYMVLAIENHGLIKGVAYGLIRLSKCHPFHCGGVDEVPEVSHN